MTCVKVLPDGSSAITAIPARARACHSPPRSDTLASLSLKRSRTTGGDYFMRRALRAQCIRRSPESHFFPQASEIIPGLFVCDAYTASSPAVVASLGITHVITVLPEALHAYPRGIKHVLIPVEDARTADIARYFRTALAFIRRALDGGGRVLVHCVWGMSRSATIAAAYLIESRDMSTEAALRAVRAKREIARPNAGFLKQLRLYEMIRRAEKSRDADLDEIVEAMNRRYAVLILEHRYPRRQTVTFR
ncbi:phosphatases II [Obba rivulosa]|uniref:Phosphatases II n=1 Tax=Obba rivulosa TaxID=1052685 RepID=A0A8E2AP68_9APHY|nr:phosphatases II [Obba rivulosa]